MVVGSNLAKNELNFLLPKVLVQGENKE